jgi:hypothetical protein
MVSPLSLYKNSLLFTRSAKLYCPLKGLNPKPKHHYKLYSISFCFSHLYFGHSTWFRFSCFEFRIFKGASKSPKMRDFRAFI